MRLVLLVTLLLLPIPIASEALELCAKADLRGPDPTAPRNNSPIKLREQCKSPKEVSIGSTADLAKVQANEAAIANKADQSEVDANTAAIGQNTAAIAEKAEQSAVDANTSAIAGKADQSALDALAVAVSDSTSDIADNATDIATLSARVDALDQLHTPCGADPTLVWNQNGDGTVTQCSTGLMWEMKTDDGSVHDSGVQHNWSGSSFGSTNEFDGSAKTAFLDVLNDVSNGGEDCFAGYCDWRLPTIKELSGLADCGGSSNCVATGGIVDPAAGYCGGGIGFCTTIPGSLPSEPGWSSSTSNDSASAWFVHFAFGSVSHNDKNAFDSVRAVRGGTCVSDQWYTCP